MPIEIGDISYIDEPTWQQWRKHGAYFADPLHPEYIPVTVTGSESAQVLGWSNFGSIMDLYAKKTDMILAIPEDNSKKAEIFEAGHIFEPFVAIQFMRYMKKEFPKVKIKIEKDIVWEFFTSLQSIYPIFKTPAITSLVDGIRKVLNKSFEWKPNMMYRCGLRNPDGSLKYPFAVVNTDGFLKVNGKSVILECKTTQDRKTIEEFKKGICPKKYEAQCRHSMAVMNMDAVYIVCCWGWTLNDMAVVCVERDMALEEEIMEKERKFVEAVEFGFEPDLTDQEPKLLNRFRLKQYGEPKKDSSPIELPDECRDAILKGMLADEEVKQCEKALEEALKKQAEVLSAIYPYYQDADYASYRLNDDEVIGIKLKVSKTRAIFDEEKFKNEEPAIYDQYKKEVFDTTRFGKEQKLLKNKYMVPGTVNAEKDPTYELKIRKVPVSA